MDALQYSLEQSLSVAKVTELPSVYDGDKYWIFAIVLLQKVDMSKNYAVAENDGRGNPTIVKDFGHPAKIAKILEIRPFLIAGDEILPDLKNRAHIKNYLRSNGMDDAEVDNLFSKKRPNGEAKSDEEIKDDNEAIYENVLRFAIKSRIHSYYVNYLYNAEQDEREAEGEVSLAEE